jgi:effector-binding domain-containing protein
MAEIQVKEVEPMTVMSLSFTGSYDQTQDKLAALMGWLLRVGHPYSELPLALYYDDPARVAEAELRAEVCLPIEEACEPVDEFERKELPGLTVAFALHQGPYSRISALYEEIFAWLPENGYRFVEGTPTREVFHSIPGQVDDPEEFLTEVQVPVEQA